MNVDLNPSRTALMSAAARAAHLIVDGEPVVFRDSLAERLLGEHGSEAIRYHREQRAHPLLTSVRTQATVRSRYAEDRLADAIRRGVGQYVVLGAGLDTFAYRCDAARCVRVVEVDHPSTQRWKRARLSECDVVVPDTLTYAELDLTVEPLRAHLANAGLDLGRPVFVSWLGGTMYFDREHIGRIVSELGQLPPGTELVADYFVPAEWRGADGDRYVAAVAPVASEGSEPWLSVFAPAEVETVLARHGFTVVADVGQRDAVPGELWDRADGLVPGSLSRLVHARR